MSASTAVSTKAMARAEKEATVRALLAAVESEAVAKTCTECNGMYQREDIFLHHFTNGQCEKKQVRARAAKTWQSERKPAAEVVTERRAAKLLAERHAASAGQIDVRHYEFKSLEDGRAIVFSDDSSAAVVSEVNHDRTLLATCVLPGYVVSGVQVTGIIVTDVMGAQAIMDLVELSC